ncbi:MAG: hypothetical protein IH975_02220 [Nitrospinae bacterium]|nr:hypothetical protein [Nitrospinota bacterium]
MFNLNWKALGEALYSQDAVVTAVKGAIILALWGAARVLHHYFGLKPPEGMGIVEAVKRGKMRPTKRFLALPHAKRRVVRRAEQTLYTVLTILGILFALTYFQIL